MTTYTSTYTSAYGPALHVEDARHVHRAESVGTAENSTSVVTKFPGQGVSHSLWVNPNNITANDDALTTYRRASSESGTGVLVADAFNQTDIGVITQVRVHVEHLVDTTLSSGSADFALQIRRDDADPALNIDQWITNERNDGSRQFQTFDITTLISGWTEAEKLNPQLVFRADGSVNFLGGDLDWQVDYVQYELTFDVVNYGLAVGSSSHAHTSETVTASGPVSLAVESSTHQMRDNGLVLTQNLDLVPEAARHPHTSANTAVSQNHNLTTASSGHTQTSGQVSLTQSHQLGVQSSQHGHVCDTVVLVTTHKLAPQPCLHSHTSEQVGTFTAPGNVVATPVDSNTIDISWAPVALASLYDIERDGQVIALDVAGTTYSDDNLIPATQYSYRVRAVK